MATSVDARPRWFLLPVSRPRTAPRVRGRWLVPSLVLIAALALAVCLYLRFLGVERSLWYNPYHDRSAHYLYSLKLATDIEQGRLFQLLHDLNQARIWPPLHGMAAAVVLLLGGHDYGLAVLPSLAGWVATILFGFLVARRAAPRGDTLAGLVAAFLIAASPAQRAYATDIMLESLGAALSLLSLYCYLLTVEGEPHKTGRARCLAVALLLLFLEKYNYWLLVTLALLAAEGVARGRLYLAAARELLRNLDKRRWLMTQLRHPLTWAIAALLLATGVIYQQGERELQVAGHSLSLFPPHNLIHLAYVLLFLRLAPWWWRQGRLWARQLDNRLRQLLLWLVCPISVWFLLPKHLSYFLWYLSLADRAPQQQMDLLGGVRDYATWMVQDYHASPASALVVAGLGLIGLLSWRRLRPGGVAVLALVLLASVLTPTHPNHKGRMLHSWLPALWVMAGVGAAVLWGERRRSAELVDLRSLTRRGLSLCLLGLLSISVFRSSTLAGHAVEGGPHLEQNSLLDVTDAYLAELPQGGRTLLLTTMPLKPMAQWTWLERYGNFRGLEERWYGFGAAGTDNRQGFVNWLHTTDCERLVFCETTISREGVDSGPECALHAELKDVLADQGVFRLVHERELPHLACRVQIWQR